MGQGLGFGQCKKISEKDIDHAWEDVLVPLGQRSYHIYIGPGVLLETPKYLKGLGSFQGPFIITDTTVEEYVGHDLLNVLKQEGFEQATMLSFPAGEQSKNMDTVVDLARRLLKHGCDRGGLLLALGGGVTGDICGFLASIYMRGIDFVQLPTTLLAQVDSSVGGKTGVDLPEGKNLLGTFAQPKMVLADIGVLCTLPAEEIRNGIAEIVKYGMIKDKELFERLETDWWDVINLEPQLTAYLVKRSCEIKAEVVSKDEREGGYRRILNFGHTIGHAVEAASDYTVSHGAAVAMGMVAVSRISVERGLLAKEDLERLIALLERFELPVRIPESISVEAILENIKRDKKVKAGKVNFVLAKGIGDTIITDDVTNEEIVRALEA
ncbi:MAG: 3-dehydroquinate synthase [Thermodesulfobacteria bacterium]|nr:3-dehydroquinate synthase [Thermodesulfobacteriota bacterium]